MTSPRCRLNSNNIMARIYSAGLSSKFHDPPGKPCILKIRNTNRVQLQYKILNYQLNVHFMIHNVVVNLWHVAYGIRGKYEI